MEGVGILMGEEGVGRWSMRVACYPEETCDVLGTEKTFVFVGGIKNRAIENREVVKK